MERFKLIASSYAVLLKDGKVLLARRQNTGYEDGKYGLPAGHLEDNETLLNCLVREAKEETGITIDPSTVQLAHVMHRREKDIRVDFFFVVTQWNGEPTNCETDKCDDLHWFSMNELPKNTIGYIRQAIEKISSNAIYSERGW